VGDWIEFAMFIAGVVALFAIPAWAAWTTWPGNRMFAVAMAVQATALWVALCLWLARR
jgi:hypothetical protein